MKSSAHEIRTELRLVDLFDRSANDQAYRRDLDRLRRKLDEYDLAYRVFVTNVGLPDSGWAVASPTRR